MALRSRDPRPFAPVPTRTPTGRQKIDRRRSVCLTSSRSHRSRATMTDTSPVPFRTPLTGAMPPARRQVSVRRETGPVAWYNRMCPD